MKIIIISAIVLFLTFYLSEPNYTYFVQQMHVDLPAIFKCHLQV